MSLPATPACPVATPGGPVAARACRIAGRRRPGALSVVAGLCATLASLGAALVSPAGVAAADPLEIGRPAPDFSATDSAGTVRHLADFRGKTVVLEWTNADCPYTRKHYTSGNMQSLQELARQRGVIWLSVISSAPGKQGYVNGSEADALSRSRHAVPAAVLLDPSGVVGRLYGAKTTPHMFVIDGRGDLRYMGGIDSIATAEVADIPKAEPYLKEALLAVVDDKPVSNPVTRPYGCSIKY
jgi:peroxiredoxin